MLWLAWQVAGEVAVPGSRLGADPGMAVVLYLGDWSLRLLMLSLAVTPLARRLGWNWIQRVRRMVGLFAFCTVCAHLLAYLGFLAGFDWPRIREDLFERAYIVAGFAALLLLVPLAVTSTRGWQRRLGRRWKRLHRLVYAAGALGLLHVFWLTKDGYAEPVLMLVIYLLLLAERMAYSARRTAASALSRA
jgi:sulfoxide reductase heme-binding subunit YedZ